MAVNPILRFSAVAVILLFISNAATLLYKRYQYLTPVFGISTDDWLKARALGEDRFRLIDFVQTQTPVESLFLVFPSVEFSFYAKRKSIRNFDPRLERVYQAKTRELALDALNSLEVSYVVTSSDLDPTYVNTWLGSILGAPEYVTLISSFGDHRLYQLNSPPKKFSQVQIWNQAESSRVKLGEWLEQPLQNKAQGIRVGANVLYRVHFSVRGHGLLETYAAEFDSTGHRLRSTRIWNLPLYAEAHQLDFLFRPGENISAIQLSSRLTKGERAEILAASLFELTEQH